MKYIIKERMLSLGNKFDIKDDKGNIRFVVEGKFFSMGKKLKIYNKNAKLVIEIEEKLLRLLDEYSITDGSMEIAKVSRRISLFRPKYQIESIYGDYKIDGDIFKYDFNIVNDGKIVAVIEKKFFSFSDKYSVEIRENVDHSFILALVIILDQIHHDVDGNVNNNGT